MTDETIRADAHTDRFHRDQQWHKPVRAATTGSITISTGLNNGDTIDGVTLATGDRVLVKDQGSSANGIYVVGASPGRAYDFLTGVQAMGAFVYVIDGTANGGTIWYNTNTTLPTVGSTTLTFDEFAGTGGTLAVEESGGSTTSPVDHIVFADSGDATVTVTDDGGGQVTVTVDATASGGTDPTIPSGGTLYNGTTTTGWSTFGSPDTFDANSTVPEAFYLQKTTMGTGNLVGVYRSCGSFPKTYTIKMLDGFYHADFHAGGLVFGESGGTGKFVEWGYVHDNGTSKPHRRRAWTTASSAGADTNYDATMGATHAFPAYYRIVINSSTDVEFWQSKNGYIYYRWASAVNPGFTIAIFGFGMSTFAAIEHKLAVDWIHES